MTEWDDLYYIERVKAGDVNAFSPIVKHYQRMVLTIVMKITGNREDAEDITQEIFVKVFHSINKFKGESKFSTWLYRIAYNTTLMEIRRKRIECTSFDNNRSQVRDEDMMDDPDDISRDERMYYLDNALKILPPDEVFLITLYYLNELTIGEVSRITNLSQSNVKVKLHRIRKKLSIEINRLMNIKNDNTYRQRSVKVLV